MLYLAKCYELANYYLGFNGWSVKILCVSGCVVQFGCQSGYPDVVGLSPPGGEKLAGS